jgi:hypothetical protein
LLRMLHMPKLRLAKNGFEYEGASRQPFASGC